MKGGETEAERTKSSQKLHHEQAVELRINQRWLECTGRLGLSGSTPPGEPTLAVVISFQYGCFHVPVQCWATLMSQEPALLVSFCPPGPCQVPSNYSFMNEEVNERVSEWEPP